MLNQAVADGKLAGLVLVVVDPERILREEAYGYADREVGRRQQVDDLFHIASSSKPLAATAILALVEEGKLELGSVRRLLSHTAGVFPNASKAHRTRRPPRWVQ